MSVPLDLTGKTAVVTGGGRGIGRSIALLLGQAGAQVVVTARTPKEIEATAAMIRATGNTAHAIPADVAIEQDVDRLFQFVRRQCNQLDILINNAGLGIYGELVQCTAADFDHVLAVNLRGTFLCCRRAMEMMIARKAGYIINISSVVGFKGYPRQSAYTAAKHGVMGLTKSLAVEAQPHGIRVSAVLPGGVDTDLARKARPDLKPEELLSPDDIAQTVVYLLSLSHRAAVDEIYIRRRSSLPF